MGRVFYVVDDLVKSMPVDIRQLKGCVQPPPPAVDSGIPRGYFGET